MRGGRGQIDRVLRGEGERWIASDAPAVRKLAGEPRLERATKLIAARGFMPTLRMAPASNRRIGRHCTHVQEDLRDG